MAIDPKLVEMLGLDQGALHERLKGDRDWDRRLMKEVLEPFDQILKDQARDTRERMKQGVTAELIKDIQRYNNSVSHHLSMMLVLFVVSSINQQDDPDGAMSLTAIKVLNIWLGTQAEKLFRKAKALGPIERKEE